MTSFNPSNANPSEYSPYVIPWTLWPCSLAVRIATASNFSSYFLRFYQPSNPRYIITYSLNVLKTVELRGSQGFPHLYCRFLQYRVYSLLF